MSIKQLRAEPARAPDAVPSEEHYRIFVRDLVLPCRIGAYAHERLQPQRVRFNLELKVRSPAAPLGDDLASVYSYDDAIGGIRHIVGQEHINLVETLAERIADHCLVDERVAEVKVRVEKLDVVPEAAGVGIEIERRRRAHPAVAELFPLTATEVTRRRGGA